MEVVVRRQRVELFQQLLHGDWSPKVENDSSQNTLSKRGLDDYRTNQSDNTQGSCSFLY